MTSRRPFSKIVSNGAGMLSGRGARGGGLWRRKVSIGRVRLASETVFTGRLDYRFKFECKILENLVQARCELYRQVQLWIHAANGSGNVALLVENNH